MMTPAQEKFYERGMLVRINLKKWAARSEDKKVTKETTEARGASSDAGRWIKNLLPGSEVEVPVALTAAQKKKAKAAADTVNKSNSHKRLMAHMAAMYQWHYANTLPWSNDGERIIPMSNWQTYTDGYREHKETFERLLPEFLNDYPYLKAQAKKLLNGDYRESEYPENMEARFRCAVKYREIPTGDFRCNLGAAELEELRASTEADVREGMQIAQNDAVTRLYDCVAKIHERLSGTNEITSTFKCECICGHAWEVERKPKQCPECEAVREHLTVVLTSKCGCGHEWDADRKTKVCPGCKAGTQTFRDTLVQNARDLCDVLKRLNVMDDPQLEKFRRETELLANTDAEALRKEQAVRSETAIRAEVILNDMTAVFGKDLFKK